VSTLLISTLPSSFAAKTGSACKKLNAKGWDGENPIVCKKVKNKLVWTKFEQKSPESLTPQKSPESLTPQKSPESLTNNLQITLIEINETLAERVSSEVTPERYCDIGGYKYRDISATTGVEVRDGNSALLATGVLGNSTVVVTDGIYGNCVFTVQLNLKQSDFYQIKIGTRYNTSFSRADLERKGWKLSLFIGR
jgi:hypothetical protein